MFLIMQGLTLALHHEIRIAPSQTRIIPVVVERQDRPYILNTLEISVTFIAGNSVAGNSVPRVLLVSVPILHHESLFSLDSVPLKATYFYARSMPTAFLAVPPLSRNLERPCPPLLCLRRSYYLHRMYPKFSLDGAGVDIMHQRFWIQSLPKNHCSWLIAPTGRTSWVCLRFSSVEMLTLLSSGTGLARSKHYGCLGIGRSSIFNNTREQLLAITSTTSSFSGLIDRTFQRRTRSVVHCISLSR